MIPYGKQDITEDDINAVNKVLRSNFITQGPIVPSFEQELCDYTGAKHAVAVNSCTSALHIACLSLGLGPGDILWTSPITFVASANCALYCGAVVDFVDIDSDTALMSIEKLSAKLKHAKAEGKLPKIVIPVHFAGQPCDMREIHDLSQKYGFKIIEDAAHAIGAKYQDYPVGSCQFSDITVFSFHPVKIITTGEGGVATTNNSTLSDKMKLLRSHGITRDTNKMQRKLSSSWYYEQIDLGFNYRMTDIQAALGCSQINRLDLYVTRRTEISKWYNEQFKRIDIEPLVQKSDRRSSHHLYVIKVKGSDKERDELYDYLYKNGIGVNLHYIPVYKQGIHSCSNILNKSEDYYQRAISLPMFPTMTYLELKTVVKYVLNYFNIKAIENTVN